MTSGSADLEHVVNENVAISDRTGQRYEVRALTQELAELYAASLVALHNEIPLVEWSVEDLLTRQESAGRRPYLFRWRLSLAVFADNECIGLLLAYFRPAPEAGPIESVYIHRLAVDPRYQLRGIGSALVRFAISKYFAQLRWLLSVTLQTNLGPENRGVMHFYHRLGFRQVSVVQYPHKKDALLEVDRFRWVHANILPTEAPGRAAKDIASSLAKDVTGPPIVYFGSSSPQKIEQYTFLLRSFGFELRRARQEVSLVEPQVEGSGLASEELLVVTPLKGFAPFAQRSATYPFMIEDTMLFVEHFNRDFDRGALLPGPDTKRWWQALGVEGLLELMRGSERRRARYVCQLGLNLERGGYRTFRSELPGRIARQIGGSARGSEAFPYTNATFFHRVFIANSQDVPLSELAAVEFQAIDYRRACVVSAIETLRQTSVARPVVQYQEMLF